MSRILVVDDDAVIRRLCTSVLKQYDHTVLAASNGVEANDLLQTTEVDLVLSDVSMPGMTGIELLKLVHGRNPESQVIIMTGFATVDVAVQALKEGASDFIRKPFETIELVRVVNRCLESLRQKEELKTAQTELRRKVEELRRSDEAKAHLIAMIAHDVRAPLVGMRTVLELMTRGRTPRKELNTMLEELHHSACTVSSLLDNLLDLSRIELGRLRIDPSPLDIRRLIEDCLPGWRHASPARQIQLEGAFPTVHADKDRVLQILMNLVSNAMKFSPQDRPIILRGETVGEWFRLEVQDFGPGIPADEIPRLFDRFYRAQTQETRHVPGAGLGLSIVKSLVGLHGGTAWVESVPGQGSSFFVTLPLVLEAANR
ncbi:MAG: sensor histidine kinase [Candidatus Xenobia bacterium]